MVIFLLYAGMRFLDFRDKWLAYGQEAVMPFYLLHQPVIFVIAFFVVQWDTSTMLGTGAAILLKLPVIVLSAFVVTLGLYQVVIRRVKPVRAFFGMKPKKRTGG